MSKIIVSEFVSVDGVVEEPRWTMPYWNDELAAVKHAELFACDALLLGRVTYQGFVAAWPGRTDEQGYADRINALPKHVVSTTLEDATWNARLIRDDVVGALTSLKETGNQDLLVFGSGTLVQTLIAHRLVDVWRLCVYPIVLGKGRRLFEESSEASLTLVDSQTTKTGVMILTYQRAE